MTDDTLLNLIEKLATKTKTGSLKWERTANENQFQTVLANIIIRVGPEFDDDGESALDAVTLVDKEGTILETVFPYQLRNASAERHKDRNHAVILVKDIYNSARRQALGVDKIVKDILSELDRQEGA